MVSKALFTSFPIVAALQEADAFIANILWEEKGVRPEEPLQWIASNDVQTALIGPRIWDPTLAALAGFAEGEMSSVASLDVEVINAFLHKEGFETQLRPWPTNHALSFCFGTAARDPLDLLTKYHSSINLSLSSILLNQWFGGTFKISLTNSHHGGILSTHYSSPT